MISEDGTPKILDKEKIKKLLRYIYSEQGTNIAADGVIAKKYYCRELWKELFDDEDYPSFMM